VPEQDGLEGLTMTTLHPSLGPANNFPGPSHQERIAALGPWRAASPRPRPPRLCSHAGAGREMTRLITARPTRAPLS